MKNTWALYLLVGLICIAGTWMFLSRTPEVPASPGGNFRELQNHIDSLNIEIVSIKKTNDSLSNIVDTTKQKIIVNNEKYKENYINITNQSLGDDILFFSNYLSESNPRFFSSNNTQSTKVN